MVMRATPSRPVRQLVFMAIVGLALFLGHTAARNTDGSNESVFEHTVCCLVAWPGALLP